MQIIFEWEWFLFRDCGVGEPYFANQLLRRSSGHSHRLDSPSHDRVESTALPIGSTASGSGSKEVKLEKLLRLDPAIEAPETVQHSVTDAETNLGDLKATLTGKAIYYGVRIFNSCQPEPWYFSDMAADTEETAENYSLKLIFVF